MSISVRDLVGQPQLRIEVLSGESGLDRAVSWAHSSDLAEPWDWLAGGEMLMKNGRTLSRDAAGQTALIDGLAHAGASALVIGTDPQTPPVAPEAITRADALGLPVLRVPYSVSFIVLSRIVADASMHEESRRLARAGRIYGTIRVAVAGSDPAAFLARLEAELGCRLFVLDTETGAGVLDGTPKPTSGVRAAMLTALDRRGGAVPGLLRLDDGSGQATVAVEVPYEEPTLLVAQRSDGRPFDLALLQHAATAIAVEVAHASLRLDHRRQLGTELLAQLLDARLDTAAAARQLSAHGIDPGRARLLAAGGPAKGAGEAGGERQRRLHIGLRRRGIVHLLLRRRGVLFVLLAGGEPDGAAAAFVRDRLGEGGSVGASNPLGPPARAPEAAREAMWALAVAGERADGIAWYSATSPLPGLRDPAEAQALVDRTLGTLIEYDRTAGTELMRSLAVFLACRRSWQRTAERLSVHRQTVVYRMERVTQLTGRTLSETSDIAELWLALSALDVLTGASPEEGDAASDRM